METRKGVRWIETSRVAPPSGSVPDATLPLTFFDILWLKSPPVRHLFFYDFPNPGAGTTHCFLHSHLPDLKCSLSLALQLFYPLAGTLSLDSDRYIRYREGDSVQLIVAESNWDLRLVSQDAPKQATTLQSLVPQSLPTDDLLSLQLTVFPGDGASIGVCVHHAAADGSSTMHFLRHWASIARSRLGFGGGVANGRRSVASVVPRPVCDRSLVPDVMGLKRIFSVQLEGSGMARATADEEGWVQATFVLGRAQLEGLRRRVAVPECSPFTLACGYLWVCLVRAREGGARGRGGSDYDSDDHHAFERSKFVHFKFDSGCRARMNPPIPDAYVGNCIRPCYVCVDKRVLAEDENEYDRGIAAACEAIWRVIQGETDKDLSSSGRGGSDLLKDAGGWIGRRIWIAKAEERLISLTWSPKIGVYDVDFGLGRPRKVEMVWRKEEERDAVSLMERRDGVEGFEMGLTLPNSEMERFFAIFHKGLRL